MKDGKNRAWRIAVLELDGEWMGKETHLGALFVRFQGVIEYYLKIC